MSLDPSADPTAIVVVAAGEGRRKALVRTAAVATVVVVVAGAAAAGHLLGRRAGDNADAVQARRALMDKSALNAAAAEREVATLGPAIAALQARQQQLETGNAAALERLRARKSVTCAVNDTDIVEHRPVRVADAAVPFAVPFAVPLANALRDDFPCGAGNDDDDYAVNPSVSVDVVAFGALDAGPCAGAVLVRMSIQCSYRLMHGCDCGEEEDECDRFREPDPTFRWDDDWGCIRVGHSGKESLAPTLDCADVIAARAGEVVDEHTAHGGATLYWAMSGQQAIYLARASSGWPELSDAEVAPGQNHEAELKLVLRVDDSVQLPVYDLPNFFVDGPAPLDAAGAVSTGANVAPAGARVMAGLWVFPEGNGLWSVITPEGTARRYREWIDPTMSFADARITVDGVVVGDQHVCRRTADLPPAPGNPAWTTIGSDGGNDLLVEGKPPVGQELAQVRWASPFGNLWTCNNRSLAPHPAVADDPPWQSPATDEDREQTPWCF